MVFEVARANFPSELVMQLPAPFLKEVINAYPMTKRVELLHSRDEETRSTLMDILADKGSPARDMIDMELENLARDPARGGAIEAQSEEIWQEFVKFSRVNLSKNASYASFAEKVVREWSQKLGQSLKAIQGGKAAA
jgi:hypothetical protein